MKTKNKQVKERPVIFTTDEVRATLEGRKSQHRVLIEDQSDEYLDSIEIDYLVLGDNSKEIHIENTPYGNVGDRLWVQEDLLFEITDIRIEKILSTTEDDAIKSGYQNKDNPHYKLMKKIGVNNPSAQVLHNEFRDEHGSAVWKSNPWVWVIDFKVLGVQ